MRFLFLVCNDPEAEPYVPELDTIGEWCAAMDAGGHTVLGDRLRPSEEASTVRRRQGELMVTPGTASGTGNSIAGFDVIEAADLQEAVACAAKHPMARFGRIEVRAFWPLST